ncbi:lipase class 3 [Nitzschia inconspicua]|uniref:Lipase class 3 n=1 Tax=Nitzschia inconspicua TaxID=303405 RepID=A0A9K3LXE0_9STRA|nr:lipase class 3 [Nitzschia inconspicua]
MVDESASSFSALFGEDFPMSLLHEKGTYRHSSEDGDRSHAEEECIDFFANNNEDSASQGYYEWNWTSSNEDRMDSFVDETEGGTVATSLLAHSHPPPPFAPGDHVYQWCSVAGIPAFHHHAIVMQVYWDTFDGVWMLHVSDFSNISLYDATAASVGRRQQNGSGSTSFTSGSNPFLRNKKPGSWRSYASLASQWQKVIYNATFWQQVTNLSAGTCTCIDCDPPVVVQARVQFLQLNSAPLLARKPYHWLYNNCEAAAVWCKTGKWCTLQALHFLTTAAAGQAQSTAFLAGTAAATQVTVIAPAPGIWGSWFGVTTTTQLPLLVSQPYLIPVLVAYGLITVGVPTIMIHNAKKEWHNITMSLNDIFWSDHALQRPEVFVEYIKLYYNQEERGQMETVTRTPRKKKAKNKENETKTDSIKTAAFWRRRNNKGGLPGGSQKGISLVLYALLVLQLSLSVVGEVWISESCSYTSRASTKAHFGVTFFPRGGATSSKSDTSYQLLAKFLQDKFPRERDSPVSQVEMTNALMTLSLSQQTFKSLDGVAHEAYQRTHTTDDLGDTLVSGRAQRSASRLASVAEAFHACELIEVVHSPFLLSNEMLAQKDVVLNMTASEDSNRKKFILNNTVTLAGRPMPILVLYEPSYNGGAGLDHSTMISLTSSQAPQYVSSVKGRLLIVLGDPYNEDWLNTLRILDEKPHLIRLSSGLVTNEVASVQPTLYQTAGQLLTLLEPHLRYYNSSAIHFVGHSLAGGVASLAATMLDGSIGMPKLSTKDKGKKRRKRSLKSIIEQSDGECSSSTDNASGNTTQFHEVEAISLEALSGLGRGRSSALSLGLPPCLSSNVLAAFCTSFIYGDDIVSRTTQDSINKLVGRIEEKVHGGFITKNLGWVTDTFSLAVSSLQSHGHGSEGEEEKLSIPGRAYLLRPRRLANVCSIHEVGNLKKGGREALREALLWQLQDVLLSKSMWKHHDLESYIQGLEKVQLRSVLEQDSLEQLE